MMTVTKQILKFFRFANGIKFLSSSAVMAAILLSSGCAEYAMKKDLQDLQEKVEKTNVDPAILAALAERVEKMEKYTKELEGRREEAQPGMSLDIKKVEVEYKDIDSLNKRVEELDNRLKSINAVKKVELKDVQFPLGRVLIKDLPKREQVKLLENAERIKEERPSRVAITTWSDSSGSPERRKKVAAERAKNIAAFYRKKIGEALKIEFRSFSKVATIPGTFWRRADTTMWMTQE